MRKAITIELKAGIRTALIDGTLVKNSPKHMASEHLYKAVPGNRISLHSDEYLFAVALFSPERDMKYIYTFDYQPECNWTTYLQNLTPDSYSDQDYIFGQECYFRICLKRRDGQDITDSDAIKGSDALCYEAEEEERNIKQCFLDEISKTAKDILAVRKDLLTFCILTDTHYTVNGTWVDTALNIQAVHKLVGFDGIIHLGDLTDGVCSYKVTSDYVNAILADLESNQIPVHIALGNHDSNYFRANPDKFTIEDQIKLYLDKDIEHSAPYYYVDYEKYNLRCLFLHSFDDEAPIRYGFSKEMLEWVRSTLEDMKGGNVLVFSHDAPLAELDYWSYSIRNGEKLMDILEEYNLRENYHILGYFYGHTHADSVYENSSFPLVSIACNKCEYFEDKKPKGARVPKRYLNDVSQDLWDALILDIEDNKIHLIRFGAGNDRVIDCSKRKSVRKQLAEERKRRRRTKVWAHRGASGYAPENTLPAFALAIEMGCDGLELDVHLTKDGIPVVTHDERIDRVSDGSGYVSDYTLTELKGFNFGISHPVYGKVEIPTLEEVYSLLKNSDVIINLELKNNRCFYEDLEEKVLDLARKYDIEDRIRYSSFNHSSMVRIKQLKDDAQIIFLHRDGFIDIEEYTIKHGAYALQAELSNVRYPGYMDKCRGQGIAVHVWTVNDMEDMRRMVELGVDVIVTNYPDKAGTITDEFSLQ